MSRKQQRQIARIVIAGAAFLAAMLLPLEGAWRLCVYLLLYALIGWDILWRALCNIAHGQIFDENFLMAVASIGALVLGEYPEAVAVLLFYQVGEAFQSAAIRRSRQSIAGLMDIRPDYANVEQEGELVRVEPEKVNVGQRIVVRPGERIPLDGIVEEGVSAVDTSALTGESMPRDAAAGDAVLSGCVNLTGSLTIRVSKEYGESTVAKILDLVENASGKKARAENFITRFARYYTPAVVGFAVLLAVIPPLLIEGMPFADWISRALTFLVISCPCALVISVPLSFFGGIGGASKRGILVKGGNYLEALARAEIMVFDKTGTLTKGQFAVTGVYPEGMDAAALLELAAHAECDSGHPIARSILSAYSGKPDRRRVGEITEVPGRGLRAVVDGRAVLAGSRRLLDEANVFFSAPDDAGTVVYFAVDGQYAGRIVIEDSIKEGAAEAIAALRQVGIRQTVMLTGDNQVAGRKVAGALGIDAVYAGLLPAGKVEKMEQLLGEKSPNGKLAFVGDGVNDAPVLARADIGIAMGGLGSDAAIEAADVVIMDDDPAKIPEAIGIARKTLRIVRQNIVFALAAKLVVLVLGAFGIATMWAAVFADVGVSVIAILNAVRALRAGQSKAGRPQQGILMSDKTEA